MISSGQPLPVRVYHTHERIMLAAPMPGLEAENILVHIDGSHVTVHGEQRGRHQQDVPLAIAEWSIGPYHREVDLAEPVDGSLTNATYGNGVLVLSMPKVSTGHTGASAIFRLVGVAGGRGERIGHIGHDVVPQTTEEHWENKHAVAAPAAYRRILVALDGSAAAETVIPLAAGLVERPHGSLVLLRVLHHAAGAAVEVPADVVEAATQEMQSEVEQYLMGVAHDITRRGLRVQTITRSGDPAWCIVDAARETEAALIAMTTHGRSGVKRVLFGSVAESVVRDARVPVLLMRGTARAAIRHAA